VEEPLPRSYASVIRGRRDTANRWGVGQVPAEFPFYRELAPSAKNRKDEHEQL